MATRPEPLKTVILVAHGSPSDPDSQESALRELASRVQSGLTGWRIGSATLAAKGRLEEEVARLGTPLIYPFFMARGWFTGQMLAKKARVMGLTMLDPFGVEPELVASAQSELRALLAEKGWDAPDTALVVAAHGSAVSKTSADSAYAFARALHSGLGFRDTRTGFIDQPPFLKDIAQGAGQAICLPYFAQNSGHIEDDVPAALSAAGFDGPVMPPFISWSDTARLIGDSIERQSPEIPARAD
ncbi:cobalamin biosynthesis protein CbiX [Salipiger aestuarii]|uniref:CbiX protein n=1 Tax=Salipiger aestuarii TaxID=568098 RepID=A0A327YB89_9RHOB|nr:CbiX/SirB N-terminal domain-containing protein [Salipiger aestuarii]EIE51355.1 cobalamin (vitamin B12) biosynthesis CbiX protein [Citreicella sp. 357]KAA8608576.1 cobalamin biosynthesis protein CbiX [Salipiger aestuarii]KAA8614174.1 cobalamin biosynthesis protein CbiX [Salipiger aestuarii]KAB2542349.1 cobalamin biosynthesis protein CbiX [Salipiger aestuarii]RAK18330.1 CbiX protein [Salipiger aestuarii]